MLTIILLATFNGEKYLGEQIDSLLAQTHRNWQLWIQDDGSSDATSDIVSAYQRAAPNRIYPVSRATVCESQHPASWTNQGPLRAFSALLEHAVAATAGHPAGSYCFALCDQDDIWHRDRLRLGVERMNRELAANGPDAAILVYGEMRVVDAAGAVVAERFSEYQDFRPWRTDFTDLIVQNVVSGCSSLLSPALARATLPIPAQAAMHDWWLALTASQTGRLCYLPEPLVDYRQHGGNAVGAQHSVAGASTQDKIRILMGPANNANLAVVSRQAGYVLTRGPWRLSARQRWACLLTFLLGFRLLPLRIAALRAIKRLRRHSASPPGDSPASGIAQ